jgi:hypothetical protein
MNHQQEFSGDAAYAIWNERSIIADCLKDLGFEDLAKKAMQSTTTQELIKKFLTIIEREAAAIKRQDVLEQLYFAGLIYG